MIVCPNCNHQNPDAAVQCEACYTPLPAMIHCPSCGAAVQSDASFCGQCGFNLNAAESGTSPPTTAPELEVPDLLVPDPLIEPDPLLVSPPPLPASPPPTSAAPLGAPSGENSIPDPLQRNVPPPAQPEESSLESQTKLQTQTAQLVHIRTNTVVELPSSLSVIHIGKPNERIPPDVDVSGFPDSEVVSRVHADIRSEAGIYYIEDVGSSNGTYINNIPLPMGNRHRLRSGDRIALGKGDKVSFLFQLS